MHGARERPKKPNRRQARQFTFTLGPRVARCNALCLVFRRGHVRGQIGKRQSRVDAHTPPSGQVDAKTGTGVVVRETESTNRPRNLVAEDVAYVVHRSLVCIFCALRLEKLAAETARKHHVYFRIYFQIDGLVPVGVARCHEVVFVLDHLFQKTPKQGAPLPRPSAPEFLPLLKTGGGRP